MHHLSHYVIESITKQRQLDNQRRMENIRLVKLARLQNNDSLVSRLKKLLKRYLVSSPKRMKVDPSENELISAEMLGLSVEQLRHLEAKRLFYERIMRGNALVETEYHISKLQGGR